MVCHSFHLSVWKLKIPVRQHYFGAPLYLTRSKLYIFGTREISESNVLAESKVGNYWWGPWHDQGYLEGSFTCEAPFMCVAYLKNTRNRINCLWQLKRSSRRCNINIVWQCRRSPVAIDYVQDGKHHHPSWTVEDQTHMSIRAKNFPKTYKSPSSIPDHKGDSSRIPALPLRWCMPELEM